MTECYWRKALLWGAFLLVWLAPYAPALPESTPPQSRAALSVKYVVDGDTLILSDNRHVRLIGINTPELGRRGAADEPLARAAWTMLKRLVDKNPVLIVTEKEGFDHYGRQLAHVLLPGAARTAQESLLEKGLAFAIAIPPNLDRLAPYFAAEQRARDKGLGVWAHPHYRPLAAEALTTKHKGFRRVEGVIREVRRGRKYIFLEMAPHFSLQVPYDAWRYFNGQPEDLMGKRIVARGWVKTHKKRMWIHLQHPAMLERLGN